MVRWPCLRAMGAPPAAALTRRPSLEEVATKLGDLKDRAMQAAPASESGSLDAMQRLIATTFWPGPALPSMSALLQGSRH